jgi:hypothetical protein
MLLTTKSNKSLSLLNRKVKLSQLMWLHPKINELLPPEKKARLIESKTEQCHEHLTEEEKRITAQIRSPAATLYEKVDLNESTVEFLRGHFYKDPTLALAYFHCCSTDPRVAIFNDKLQTDVD